MESESGTFQQQVAPLLAEMEASANVHDTDRHMAVYVRSPALVFIMNGEIIRGWDGLREKQRQWWNDGKAVGSYEYVGEPVCEVLGDDAGLTSILIAARSRRTDGLVVERQLVYTGLWRRLPEGWRIVHAHESSTR